MSMQRCFLAGDADATRALGAALANLAPAGLLLRLEGPLGAGKTTLCQGFGRGLGIVEPLLSPSFTLIREYELPSGLAGPAPRPERLVHADLYRLAGAGEAIDLGLDDYLSGDDLVLVEWPRRGGDLLPQRGLIAGLERVGRPDRPERGKQPTSDAPGHDAQADAEVRRICLIALDASASELLARLEVSDPGLREIAPSDEGGHGREG